MSDQQKAGQATTGATARKPTPYKEMRTEQKLKFILKLAVCIVSFGMIFPNVMSD